MDEVQVEIQSFLPGLYYYIPLGKLLFGPVYVVEMFK